MDGMVMPMLMSLITEVLLVPLAPARLALWSLDQVLETATREYDDPATIRRDLAELSRQLDEGTISAAEFDAREDEILARLDGRGTYPEEALPRG